MIPKTRTDWWVNKINTNIDKDLKSRQGLIGNGWKVIEIWECDLKKATIDSTLTRLLSVLK